MNYRNRFMGTTRVFEVPGTEGANGGGQAGNGNPNPPAPKPAGIGAFANFWDPPKPATTPSSGGTPPAPAANPPAAPGGGGNQDYYSNQNYFQNQEVTTAMAAAWESRDFAGFQKAMGNWMRDIHAQLGAEMNTFGKHYYDKAVKDAVGQASNSYRIDQVYEQAYSKYPELKLPAINKIAREGIANAIRNGKSVDEAIELTHNYFKEVGTTFTKPPANPNGRGIVPGGENEGPALDVDALFGSPASS